MKKAEDPIVREKIIVGYMIEIYCKNQHNDKGKLCVDCEELRNYSIERLNSCRYAINKPVCKNCTTHCYNPAMKERIIKVMRYSGPRMIVLHPVHAFYYIFKKFMK